MATQYIKFKRSSIPGKRPSNSQMELGELALNTNDGRIFTKKENVGVGTTITLLNVWTENVGGGAYYNDGNVGIGTTNPTSKLSVKGDGNFTGVVTATAFYGNGSNLTSLAGMGTAVSTSGFGADVFFTNSIGYVTETTTLSSPDPSSSPTLYTRYEDIVVSDGVDLIIGTGNELFTDVLQLSQLSVI